jgi:hypothetical protein
MGSTLEAPLIGPQKLFVLWVVKVRFCVGLGDFRNHYGRDFPISKLVDELRQGGFLRQSAGKLVLTETGEQAVACLEDDEFSSPAGSRYSQQISRVSPMRQSVPNRSHSEQLSLPTTFVEDLGTRLIKYLVHPFAVFAPPAFLCILLVYLIIQSFAVSFNYGVRSFSAVLLPIVIAAFFSGTQRDMWEKMASVKPLKTFAISLIWGGAILGIVHFAKLYGIVSQVPVTEIVLSGSFAILMYGHVHISERILPFYYGMISGFLVYVMLFGLP